LRLRLQLTSILCQLVSLHKLVSTLEEHPKTNVDTHSIYSRTTISYEYINLPTQRLPIKDPLEKGTYFFEFDF
jgi:hypothetical protein